jgi:hypothetical protein
MLMEFLPNSLDLGEISKEELEEKDVSYYYDIGSIAIFDILLNNWDRMPIWPIWKHEGNVGNLFFCKTNKHCYAIDQSITFIDNEKFKENYEKYTDSIIEFLKILKEDPYQKNGPIDSIEEFFYTNSGLKFTEENKKDIVKGMYDTINLAVKINEIDIKKLKDEVVSYLTGSDWENVYSLSCARISVGFINSIIILFKEYFG